MAQQCTVCVRGVVPAAAGGRRRERKKRESSNRIKKGLLPTQQSTHEYKLEGGRQAGRQARGAPTGVKRREENPRGHLEGVIVQLQIRRLGFHSKYDPD